jgi:tagatose 6-phosphate kinase
VIVAVCLNPAVDITYGVDEVVPGGSHRVTTACRRAGGKGVNVARILRQLGEPVTLTTLQGADHQDVLGRELRTDGIRYRPSPVAGDVRQTVTATDGRDATVFSEPGPVVSAAEWQSFVYLFTGLLRGGMVVTLSGSLPRGVPADAYRRLVEAAHAAGAAAVVDADGPALRHSLAAHPEVVKPNAVEAASLLGRPVTTVDDALAAARLARDLGARSAVVSRGPRGLVAVAPDGAWCVGLPLALTGNPTGAGDALVAALASGLARGRPWPEILRHSTAVSAAAVAVPHAGAIDTDLVTKLRQLVIVEAI